MSTTKKPTVAKTIESAKRESGVLLPIPALMSEYGIGDFGRNAYSFIDYIAGMGFSVWQILPITTIGAGNSPYSGVSAFAGNYMLIDLESIPERLLTTDEKNSAKYYGSVYKTDYAFVADSKKRLLRTAFSRLDDKDNAAINAFKKRNLEWLDDYALYSALREKFGCGFTQWDEKYKFRNKETIKIAKTELKDQMRFFYFEQYVFSEQWQALKNCANQHGVKILGDMPIYVDHESVDVWSFPKIFDLDIELKPKRIAGVPPDYFADDGQLWGNPVYNFTEMEKTKFRWLVSRMKRNLEMYDMLRIDHFRGLYQFWAIDAQSDTAKKGTWVDGPKLKLWRAVARRIRKPSIIAEDLGIIDEPVRKYLNTLGFPGMRVFQFGFDGSSDNTHLPHNYQQNSVAYVATHDNNTTLGWLYRLDNITRERVLSYLFAEHSEWGMGGGQSPAVKESIRAVLASSSNLAIILFQDMCGYGSDTRINSPGVPEGNWEYRTTFAAFEEIDTSYFLRLNRQYGRTDRI
ncbi:MAG: 4-alpha-glucanotransferase [Christensenellaceae bacterium]|jgi:4-alpha-glucanotransferase|nr:4-alpha-glucanotransferase [Christensenellaceae bacterium]